MWDRMKERFGFRERHFADDRDRYRGGDYDRGGRWESGARYDDYDHYNSGHGGWRGPNDDYARRPNDDYARGGYDGGRDRGYYGPRDFGGRDDSPRDYDRGPRRDYGPPDYGRDSRREYPQNGWNGGGRDFSRGDWNRGGIDRGYDRDRWSGARDDRYANDYYDRGPRYRSFEREFDPVEPRGDERDPRREWRGGRNRY